MKAKTFALINCMKLPVPNSPDVMRGFSFLGI